MEEHAQCNASPKAGDKYSQNKTDALHKVSASLGPSTRTELHPSRTSIVERNNENAASKCFDSQGR